MAGVAGRSGTKPKPNREKQLTKSRHANASPVEFDTIKNVEAPEWLPELGRQMWQTVCPHLCAKKVISVTDLHNLEAFCSAYSQWRTAEREVIQNGIVVEGATGGPIKNPACTVVNESLKQMALFGANLGLDPASRGRLVGAASPTAANPFSKF